jgi:hypothetical protein
MWGRVSATRVNLQLKTFKSYGSLFLLLEGHLLSQNSSSYTLNTVGYQGLEQWLCVDILSYYF